MEEKENIQDWDDFVNSNKSKTVDAEWKIKMFKQGKKHIADFIIELEALVIKAETDDIHVIFLLKKNIRSNIIKTILKYLPIIVMECFGH